jgi:hypothetical protein
MAAAGMRDTDRGPAFALAYGGAFGAFTSACLALLFAAARSGLPTPELLPVGCLVLFAAFAFAPFAVPERARAAWQRAPCLAPLASLAVLCAPIAALASAPIAAALVLFVAAFGLRGAAGPLRSARCAEAWLLAAGPPLFALYLFASLYPYPFAHVFAREYALLGLLTGDSALHAALAHLIQSTGSASSGLDGLVPIHYHFASHAWFAGLGLATGSTPLLSYPAGMSIVVLPALSTSLFLAIACLARSGEGVAGRMLAALALVLVFDRIGWESCYVSESHALGLCAVLLGLPCVEDLVVAPERRGSEDALRLVGALATVAIAASTKSSAGAIYAVVLGWAVVRLHGVSRRSAAALAALGGVFLLVHLRFGPRAGFDAPSLFAPLDFYRRFDPFSYTGAEVLDPRKAHSSWILPLALVAASAFAWRARGGAAVANGSVRRGPGPAELVLVAALAAALPGLLLALAHDAWWFQNSVHWLALAFVVAALPLAAGRTRRTIAGLAAFALLALGADRLRELPERLGLPVDLVFAGIDMARGGIGIVDPRETRLRESLARERALFAREIAAEIDASPLARAAELVLRVKELHDPRELAVYVPSYGADFWGRDDACQRRPFLIPALTGVPVLKGIPASCARIRKWGAFCCRDYGPASFTEPLGPKQLCAHARERGVGTVFVLRSVEEPDQNRILNCRNAKRQRWRPGVGSPRPARPGARRGANDAGRSPSGSPGRVMLGR